MGWVSTPRPQQLTKTLWGFEYVGSSVWEKDKCDLLPIFPVMWGKVQGGEVWMGIYIYGGAAWEPARGKGREWEVYAAELTE